VDASPVGVGAVISHEDEAQDRPIAFASRSLTDAERNYSQIDREALAIMFGVRKFRQYLYGKKFTLWTDNKPLSHIVAMKKGIPILAAARIQRWCLELAAYTYEVRHRPAAKQGNVDALSRLPVQEREDSTDRLAEEATAVNKIAIDSMPVTAKQIAQATRTDQVLSRVYEFTMTGWPESTEEELKPYTAKKSEISVEEGCLLWGTRVIIPSKFRDKLLRRLHEQHPGMVRMKSVARMHCWWPNLDRDVETMVRSCQTCQKSLPSPRQLTNNNWAWPNKPWQRLHMDFAQYKDSHYLVVVDAHSKWPEVIEMKKGTSANRTIEALREIFARLGIPSEVCSDNGPPFPSKEMECFMKRCGVKQIFSPPYHPQSNGEAERFVRTLKEGLRRRVTGSVSQDLGLQDFLLTYRTTPNCTTGRTPSEMLYGFRIRTRLDLIKPDLGQTILQKRSGDKMLISLSVGDRVLARDYRGRKPQWTEGVVLEKLSPVTYNIEVPSGGDYLTWKRHTDQIRAYEAEVTGVEQKEHHGADWMIPEGAEEQMLEPTLQEGVEPDRPDVRASGERPSPCADVDVELPNRPQRTRKRPSYLDDYICY
jgi:transposase InsO family protein